MRIWTKRVFLALALSAAVPGAHAGAVVLEVGSATGKPGQTVTFDVVLRTQGAEVAGTINNILIDHAVPVAADDTGDPVCDVNGMFESLNAFGFQPENCRNDVDCDLVRSVVVTFPPQAIPDGTVLYSCAVDISETATVGAHPLVITDLEATDSDSNLLPVTGVNGEILVEEPGGGGGSGCAIVASRPAWGGVGLLVVPALLLLRRRGAVGR